MPEVGTCRSLQTENDGMELMIERVKYSRRHTGEKGHENTDHSAYIPNGLCPIYDNVKHDASTGRSVFNQVRVVTVFLLSWRTD